MADRGSGPLTYWDYLRLDKLLELQGGLEDDERHLMPDEQLHFVIVHQVLELWFKLVLREIRLARDHLVRDVVPDESIPYVVHHVRRINKILELAREHFGVMETLTPQDFLAFRDKLAPASGFQSFQHREIEILLGLDLDSRLSAGMGDPIKAIRSYAEQSPGGEYAWSRIEGVVEETTLLDALHAWLYRTPIDGSTPEDAGDEAAVQAFVEAYLDAAEAHQTRQVEALAASGDPMADAFDARGQRALVESRSFLDGRDVEHMARGRVRRIRAAALFIESYRELPLLAWPRVLLDSIVELDEHLVLFRTRHARMVERVIGRRPGTGGSAGVDYLDKTTKYRVFEELWAVRTVLLPADALPPLANADRYGFATSD